MRHSWPGLNFRTLSLLVFIKVRLNKDVRQEWIVHLKQDARGDNRAIFLVEFSSDGVEVVLVSL